MFVKLLGFDDRGKVRLSMKIVDQATGKEIPRAEGEPEERFEVVRRVAIASTVPVDAADAKAATDATDARTKRKKGRSTALFCWPRGDANKQEKLRECANGACRTRTLSAIFMRGQERQALRAGRRTHHGGVYMRFSHASAIVGVLALLGAAPSAAQAGWEQLGCKKVGFLVDKDVIYVGRHEGKFRSIRLLVLGNKVHMMDLKVIYANGAPDDIPVRDEIRAGGQTRALDLKGERRAIKEIEMVYRSQPNFKGEATVCVEGQT